MKKLILFLVLTFTAGGASAQSVQLSTYYPSPFGMYDRIRLVPRATLGAPCDPGTLYVENTGTSLQFCGAAGTWGTFAGVWTQAGNNLYPSDIANPNLRVGIGTTTPEFKLSLDNDGGILAKGVQGSGAPLTTTGAGTRLMWYPRKAAFRVGGIDSSQWNDVNIGDFSVAIGWNTLAGDTASVALGDTVTVNGIGAIALGKNITLPAASDYSLAIGYEITSTALGTGAIGAYLATTADGATVIGSGVSNAQKLTNNTSSSLAIGFNSTIPTLFIGPSAGAGTTGNVGIGTTTPNNKLQVAELVNFDNTLFSTSLGYQAGNVNTATAGTFVGYRAGLNNTGGSNTLVGYQAGLSNSTGGSNTFIGVYSGTANTTGSANTAIGRDAGGSNIGGYFNTFIGTDSAQYSTSGDYNTFLGGQSGNQNISGHRNTFVGFNAGYSNTTGSDNILIGYNINAPTATTSNYLNIGNAIYGDLSVAVGYPRIGIGTTTPTAKLEVAGGAIKATGGLIIETRTTNPGAPVTGQMWLCTDTGDATPCNGI